MLPAGAPLPAGAGLASQLPTLGAHSGGALTEAQDTSLFALNKKLPLLPPFPFHREGRGCLIRRKASSSPTWGPSLQEVGTKSESD